jgi:hypothetical protein
MTRMLRKMSVTLQQQNSPAPREGAGQRMNGGATDERARQRRGVSRFAEILGITSYDDLKVVCGKKWAYYNRDYIQSLGLT